ncbi:hypothetical protein NDU88_001542 [Pleurodeles waltl]|uniref:Uncharacterized protein n=1 Tax=Pleurodeles waltl TaxID=8319 RepID=A0AAV7THZ6_PLEWA|nr:hypothetical protein NDU88_001542 [Pleurodeles waltl]
MVREEALHAPRPTGRAASGVAAAVLACSPPRRVSSNELAVSVRRWERGCGEMGLGGGRGRGIPSRRVQKAPEIVLRVGPSAKGNGSGLASRRSRERRGG